MDSHTRTFLRNGSEAAGAAEWQALLPRFARTIVDFVSRYDDNEKWKQACLAIIGPTFVEQYFPEGTSKLYLLEPPHLLRSEALSIKRSVRAALFRFLDARYRWGFDCLLDPEWTPDRAEQNNEPEEYINYVNAASKSYSDALVRQLRFIRHDDGHELSPEAAIASSGKKGRLEQLRAVEAATRRNQQLLKSRITHFVANAAVQLAATERSDCLHHEPAQLSVRSHENPDVASSYSDPIYEYQQSPYYMKYRHMHVDPIHSDGRSEGTAAGVFVGLQQSLRGRSLPVALREYIWWHTFFSAPEYEGVCLRLKRVSQEKGGSDPTSSALKTIIGRSVDSHWMKSVVTTDRALARKQTLERKASWKTLSSQKQVKAPRGTDEEHRRAAQSFSHCFFLYEKVYTSNLEVSTLQAPEGLRHLGNARTEAWTAHRGTKTKLVPLRDKVESLLNQFYSVYSSYQEPMLPLCALLLLIFPLEPAKSGVLVSLMSSFLSLEPELHRPLARHFSPLAFNARRTAEVLWYHIGQEDPELADALDSVFREHGISDKIANPSGFAGPSALLEVWTRSMFAGFLRPDANLFLLDQCILGSEDTVSLSTDNVWQVEFVKGAWIVVSLLREQLLHAATGHAVYPVDLHDSLCKIGFDIRTKDLREAWTSTEWPHDLIVDAANISGLTATIHSAYDDSDSPRERASPEKAIQELAHDPSMATSPMQLRWKRDPVKMEVPKAEPGLRSRPQSTAAARSTVETPIDGRDEVDLAENREELEDVESDAKPSGGEETGPDPSVDGGDDDPADVPDVAPEVPKKPKTDLKKSWAHRHVPDYILNPDDDTGGGLI